MVKKEDRRVQMTKRMLKNALIEMLKDRDIYHISIRDLCETADVNRTTFYKYYGSQFDLLSDMEADILEFVERSVEHNREDPEKTLLTVCRYLEENIEFARLIINNNVDPMFPSRLFALDSIKDFASENYSELKSASDFEYLYNFLIYGAFRVVCVWINKEKRESPEVFAKIVSKTLLHL